jgi:hypothetical protein
MPLGRLPQKPPKETTMRRTPIIALFALATVLCASPASADLFTLELDAQGTYLELGNVGVAQSSDTSTIRGFGVGARGRLQILFLNVLVDYQHLFTGGQGADMLHAGLGVGYRFDAIPVIDLYIQGSIGLLMLTAAPSAYVDDVAAELEPQAGGQVRAGGGIEIPFAGDWFAVGVGADVGGHYLTGEFGYDYSVNVHFGLRI